MFPSKNLLDLAISAVCWWAFGYGIAFGKAVTGTTFNQFWGQGGFFTKGEVSLISTLVVRRVCRFVFLAESCEKSLVVRLLAALHNLSLY